MTAVVSYHWSLVTPSLLTGYGCNQTVQLVFFRFNWTDISTPNFTFSINDLFEAKISCFKSP